MNERKYALFMYWGPFGHANNHENILKVNDLINSFDWLSVKKNEAYPAFTNAGGNNKIPWPDNLKEKAPGQVNAFFRWKNRIDSKDKVEMSLFLADLKTTFEIPKQATADVSLRRVQNLGVKPGETLKWTYGTAKGDVRADAEGILTIPGLTMAATPETLTVGR